MKKLINGVNEKAFDRTGALLFSGFDQTRSGCFGQGQSLIADAQKQYG
jgi:hypothetical protein